jgi:hypothetical protein
MRGGWLAAGSLVLPSSSANLSNMNREQTKRNKNETCYEKSIGRKHQKMGKNY